MKRTLRACFVVTAFIAVAACAVVATRAQMPGYGTVGGGFEHPTATQLAPPMGPAGPAHSGAPTIIHIHHHYHYPTLPSSQLASGYAPSAAWNYGYQGGMQTWAQPWKQNWGHLGFYAYIGQQGPYTGLVVDRVVPDGPAAKMGLVGGDFILRINGQPVDTFKQVTLLFEQTEAKPKDTLKLDVWNPITNRKVTLTAEIE